MVLVASGAAYYVGWALAAIALGVVLIAGALFQSIRRRRAAF